MKTPEQIYRRYQDLQAYVGWTDEDESRVQGLAPLLEPHLPALVEDFYAVIARNSETYKVLTGGKLQIERLKGALKTWLLELLHGPYDLEYALRRWKVGTRHVEIGLDQVYTNVALSRLRDGLVGFLGETWTGSPADLVASIRSLNKLLDLDLAKIEDAYQAEYANRLQRAERLATLGQIAGGVAHELRNPLNVVRTSLYYLNHAGALSPEKQSEHMQRIERNVTRADDVITTLTNFARVPEPDLETFSVESCLREVLEECDIPARIEVTIDFPDDLSDAVADQGQLRIVLGNLIRNAIDAMSGDGRLTFSAGCDQAVMEIAVTDTGEGIAPADLGRVMEPLFSTKARGIGLGLALSRMIVERHRGSLGVVSEVGHGSTFTVRLPLVRRAGALAR